MNLVPILPSWICNNQLLEAGPVDNTYDDNGNLTDRGSDLFTYDTQNRLVGASVNGNTALYTYNHLDQRVTKTVAGTTTLFLYDGSGNIIAEVDEATGQTLAEYIWLDGTPLAFVQSGQTYQVHVDHLGTPKALTDASGQVVWKADYNPFGKASITSHGPTFNLRLPGQYYDAETGLHYNWHRYYDPDIGRYITSDPIGLAGGINTYAYALNNPVNFADPTGLWAAGLNVGGGFSFWGIHVSLSIAGIVDSDGVSGLIVTPEVGMGTRGGGVFARALYGPGDNTFDTLNGFGLSVSASAGVGSTSGTLPYRQETSCVEGGSVTSIGSHPPVMELGLGKGPAQIANTLGYGFPIGKNRLIGKAIDKLHETLEFMKGEEHD